MNCTFCGLEDGCCADCESDGEFREIIIGKSYVYYGKYQYPEFANYTCVMIHNLRVAKSEREKGLARTLLTRAIADIKTIWPESKIKIIAQPTEFGTDKTRLIKFYKSIVGIDEVIT